MNIRPNHDTSDTKSTTPDIRTIPTQVRVSGNGPVQMRLGKRAYRGDADTEGPYASVR